MKRLTAGQNVQLFQNILARLRQINPKLKVKVISKKDFWLHRVINFILNLVYPKSKKDSYMEGANTSFWRKIAMATRHGDDPSRFGNWRTLCHEWDHILVEGKWTRPVFSFLYLWPISQGVALLLLGWVGAIWTPGWWKAVYLVSWLAVVGIHFIPQLPDPCRNRWELRAYTISMHLFHRVYGCVTDEYVESLVSNFHGMMYYIMEPDEQKIRRKLQRLAADIEAGQSPVKDNEIVKIAVEEYEKMLAA